MGGIIGHLLYLPQRFYRLGAEKKGRGREATVGKRSSARRYSLKATILGWSLAADFPPAPRNASMSRRRFRLPAPQPAAPTGDGFVLFPTTNLPPGTPDQRAWQCSLYEWAFAEAQAVVQPSILERDLLGVWN
jgi:hypothetical protein